MPFVKITKGRIFSDDATIPIITMGTYLADGKLHKSKSVNFRMSRPLIQKLNWIAQDNRLRLSVLEGTGTDSGFLQVINDLNGAPEHTYLATLGKPDSVKATQGISISMIIDRFKHYVLNECPVPSLPVNFMVEGGVLIVECPDWLRYNPSSYTEPEPVVEIRKEPEPRPLNRQDRRYIGSKVARMLK